MSSWFNKIWKFTLILGMAFLIPGSAGSVFASHVTLCCFPIKAYHFTTYMQSGYPGEDTKSTTLMVGFNSWHPWQRLWYAEVPVFLLLLTAAVFIVHISISRIKLNEREKAEIKFKMAELEIKALQAQMNPHFIFNSINSIQYFVLSNKTDDVLSYLSDFSKVMRISLSNVRNKMVLLNDEIDFLNSYLRIERMRFPGKFGFSVKINEFLDPFSVKIPPYLIQPFVENAVQHGFMHKPASGNLSILLEQSDSETIKCTITDDGNRELNPKEKDVSCIGYAKPNGEKITETRIRLFNAANRPEHYHVKYFDLSDNEGNPAGLKVEIYIPFENA